MLYEQYSVEKLTKETIAQILNESTGYSVVLGEICNVLLAGDYLALRTESCERYWEEKKSIGNIRRSRREQINADIEKRESKRLKSKNVFPNEQDTILAGFEKSVASMIKYHAHQTHMNKKYSELDNYAKNSVSNGFNSILDLTENNVHPLNQKAIFTDEQWKQLNHAWNKRINWNPISKGFTEELKEIEKLAEFDIREAYKLSLNKQIKYAFTEEESYFKIYSLILSSLNFNSDLFSFNNKKDPMEQDFVVKIWGPIISTIFDDSALFTKWGDSVYEESSKAKGEISKENSSIGDKVDCRVCTQGPDVGAEGKVNKLNLVDNGLYVATKLGSLRLPTSGIELRKARTLIERLFTLKRDAKYLANCHTMLSNETAAALKSMDRKQNNSRSPYDEEQDKEKKIDHYCNWVRGSWFPPSQKKDKPYYGQYPTSLFQ
ncbi:hypothetical protein G6F56_004309 [Rhizopus delemar]|nr:hypothetical protein G6F56_004309 [Rhizopus delemar]